MSQRRIHADDAHLQQVQAALVALKSDLDWERAWLSSARQPIQPPDQVWSLAAALVNAWGHWRQSVERWNDAMSTDLEDVVAGVETARGLHGLGEDQASDLARKGIS